MGRLSTEETAARLGVKRETVYAYVSRGVLSRERAVDGKASTFDEHEVDRLRRRRLRGRPGQLQAPVTTAITEVHDGTVSYRGRTVSELASSQTGYEETAALLWDVAVSDTWSAPESMATAVARAVDGLPSSATLIDKLLAATVVASTHDPFRDARNRDSTAESMRQLVSATVDALPARTKTPVARGATIAQRLWPRLSTEPRRSSHLLDQTLMLLADHGMASSTIAARIAASTRAGPHAAVIAGLGVLNGPLHGAASRSVHELLERAQADGPDVAIADSLRTGGRVPGIGHFVHRTADPRFSIMMSALSSSTLRRARLDVVSQMVERTSDRISAPHNIDFALGSLTFAADMEPDAGELIFAIARIAGWVAHCLEEYEEAPLRFRPVGRYDAKRPRPAPEIT